ncbi:MAG: hypothetical protein ACYDC2_03120, partial [Solirubrobacteraceae bacterium]
MIGVVHLVWAPLGLAPVRSFVQSYRRCTAGAEHELVVVLNGLAATPRGGERFRSELLSELQGTRHDLLELEQPVLDLSAYGLAAARLAHDRLCFVNSYSVILCDGWLGMLDAALSVDGVGIAGATGSWESPAEWRRGAPRWWPYQLARLPLDRRRYPRFPNPHIRTTGFVIDRAAVLELGFERVGDKPAAYQLESGFDGITRTLQRRGLAAVVVGRDGRVWG